MTCFFTKIACYLRVKCKLGESNPFLRAKRAHLSLWPVFFTKVTCRVTCFLRKLHGACESNVNLVNPILFGERSEPTFPCDLFFMKIACRVRVKCKLGKCNLFLRAKRAHPLCYLFFNENRMAQKTLNKSLFYLARVILYTFRYIHANLQTFILKCMIMHLFSYLNFLD